MGGGTSLSEEEGENPGRVALPFQSCAVEGGLGSPAGLPAPLAEEYSHCGTMEGHGGINATPLYLTNS